MIAATNVDLRYAVSQGKFRADLYYRLNAIQISMPSLRERKEDIYLLFRKFTSDFSEKYGMRKINLTHDGIELLRRYRWPGNIRQLKNIAETVEALESEKLIAGAERFEVNAATLSQYIPKDDPNALPVKVGESGRGGLSDEEKQEIFSAIYNLSAKVSELEKMVRGGNFTPIPENVQPPEQQWVSRPAEWDDVDIQEDLEPAKPQVHSDGDSSLSIRGASEDLIRKALEKHNGNRKKAAEELGISERTLYRKLPPEYKNAKSNE